MEKASKCVLHICHANVRSILANSRLVDVEILAANHMVDVLCLSETWLKAKHAQSVVRLAGFQAPYRDDKAIGHGGGVAVYVRNGLAASVIKCISSPLFECIVLSLTTSQRVSTTVDTCYRPPDSDIHLFVEFLNQVLRSCQRKRCGTCV